MNKLLNGIFHCFGECKPTGKYQRSFKNMLSVYHFVSSWWDFDSRSVIYQVSGHSAPSRCICPKETVAYLQWRWTANSQINHRSPPALLLPLGDEQTCPVRLDRLCTALKLNLDADTCFVFSHGIVSYYLIHRPHYSGHSPCTTFPSCLEIVVHCLATALQIVTIYDQNTSLMLHYQPTNQVMGLPLAVIVIIE